GGLKVFERAAEALVDEDRDRRGAGVRELRRKARRVCIRPEVAGRRRAALDLGDRAEARGCERVAEAAHQVATVCREKEASCSSRSAAAPESSVSPAWSSPSRRASAR